MLTVPPVLRRASNGDLNVRPSHAPRIWFKTNELLRSGWVESLFHPARVMSLSDKFVKASGSTIPVFS